MIERELAISDYNSAQDDVKYSLFISFSSPVFNGDEYGETIRELYRGEHPHSNKKELDYEHVIA